jgi:PIN like domain
VKFFFDNTFPRPIPAILNLLEVDATHLQDHFPEGTADGVWIPEIGNRGWVLVSGDHRIRKNPANRHALEKANLITYIVHKNYPQLKRWDQVAWIIRWWPDIETHAGRAIRGRSYHVNPNGKIQEL